MPSPDPAATVGGTDSFVVLTPVSGSVSLQEASTRQDPEFVPSWKQLMQMLLADLDAVTDSTSTPERAQLTGLQTSEPAAAR